MIAGNGNGKRKGLADRIRENGKERRRGLADRIREGGAATQANLDESKKRLSSSALVPPDDQTTPPEITSDVDTSYEAADSQEIAVEPISDSEPGPEKEISERKARKIISWLKRRIDSIVSFLKAKWPRKSLSSLKTLLIRFSRLIKIKELRNTISSFFSSNAHHIQSDNVEDLKSATRKAYGYAEAHRLREKITNELKEKGKKTLVVTSPHDGTGNTFLVTVLALNAVHFSSMTVLIIDMNMRYPQVHDAFDLNQNDGFTDVIKGLKPWRDVIKDTDFKQLKVMTAGEFDFELARHLNRPNIEGLIDEVKEEYEFIIIDSSPILSQNRNNVDPSLLSVICDKVIIQVQGKKTTTGELEDSFSAITKGGGIVDGIVYNKQF